MESAATGDLDDLTWRSGRELLESAVLEEVRPGRRLRVLASAASPGQPTLLIVHGSAASLTQFLPLAAALRSRGAGFVAYDWLGCGGSEKPDDWPAYAHGELLADLTAVWRRWMAPLPGLRFVLGHSYGTRLVSMLPRELLGLGGECGVPDGLVLLSGARFFPAIPLFRLPVVALNLLQSSLTSGFLQAALAPSADPELRSEQEQACNANPMYMCKAYYRQWQQEDLGLEAVETPTLVLHGAADGAVAPSEGQALASAVPGCRRDCILIADASHNVMLEKPAEVARHVLEFMGAEQHSKY